MKLSEARRIAEQTAEESAEQDLNFSGREALLKLGLDVEQRKKLENVLLFYAKNGAVRAVVHLGLVHGAFEKEI